VLFSHNGKMVGLRTTSANVAIDGRSVTLRTDNAYAILTALDAYQLGPSGIEEQPKRAEGSEAAKKNSERPASEKGGTLVMELTTGPIKIRLRPDLAPKHVERVRLLVKEGFYNGLTFHRVIDKFMAQGGDPSGTGTGGSRHPSLTLEPSEVQFTRGTVAAARTTDPNSANSQFFICFNDYNCKQLSKQYTVWGEVIEGMENVDKLARGEPPAKPDKIISLRITE
jgi:peptidylprolyl isomerase